MVLAVLLCATATAQAQAHASEDVVIAAPIKPNIPTMEGPPRGTVRQPGAFGVNLEAWALLPLGVGGGLAIEGPAGVRAGFGFGITPGAFLTLAQESIRQPGSYSSDAVDALLAGLEDPVFGRVSLAFAPPTLSGFYIGVGYGFLRVAVSATAGEVPRSLWPRVGGITEDTSASLALTIHHVTADLGWEFSLGGNWRLRATVGGLFTFASNASLRVSGLTKVAGLEDQAKALAEAEEVIEDAVVEYGMLPSVTLTLAYRVF